MRKCDTEIGLIGLQQVISCMSERRYSSKKARFRSVKDRHVTKLEHKIIPHIAKQRTLIAICGIILC